MEHTLEIFDLKMIVQKHWPKLTKYVRNCGHCWLLSSIPGKTANTGTIKLVHRKLNGWEFATFQRDYTFETVNKITISFEFAKDLGLLLLPDSIHLTEHHDKPGRPDKYDDFVARRIVRRWQRGETIRAIAAAEKMSTATVQRLISSKCTPEQRKYIAERNRRIRKERSYKS